MANLILTVPEDLKKIIEKYKDINWDEIARKALWEHAQKVELMEKIVVNSQLTDEDTLEIGRKIKQEVAKRHGL